MRQWENSYPVEGIKQYFVLTKVEDYRKKKAHFRLREYAFKIQDSQKTFSVKLDLKLA